MRVWASQDARHAFERQRGGRIIKNEPCLSRVKPHPIVPAPDEPAPDPDPVEPEPDELLELSAELVLLSDLAFAAVPDSVELDSPALPSPALDAALLLESRLSLR